MCAMSFKLRNPKNLIFIVIVFATCWIVFWFNNIPERPHNFTVVPTIGYEFLDTFTPINFTFKHLRKSLLKNSENIEDNEQEDNDLEYADFRENKENAVKSLFTQSTRAEPAITKKAPLFRNSVLKTNSKSNILLNKKNIHRETQHYLNNYTDVPTIGYEFLYTFAPRNFTFKHLRKGLLKSSDNIKDNEQEDDDLEYADFMENKENAVKSLFTQSTQAEPAITKKAPLFKNSVLMTNSKSSILLNPKSTYTKEQKTRNMHVIDYDDKEDKKLAASNEPYILIHNDGASVVNTERDIPSPLPKYVSKHYFTFTSHRLPGVSNFRPSLSNGFIGTFAHSPNVHLSGYYNGRNSSCHLANVPSTSSFNIYGTEPATNYSRKYSLDVSTGIYSEESQGHSHAFVQRIYAHRTLVNLLVTEVDYVKKTKEAEHVTLKINLNKWHDDQDLTFSKRESRHREISYKVGLLNSPEVNQSSSRRIHILYDHVPSELKPPSKLQRCKWVFLTAYGFSRKEVERSYDKGMKLLAARDDLYLEHVKGWSYLWRRGRVDVEGDDELAPAVYAGTYALLSSVPLGSGRFFGVGSSGLPFGNETNPSLDRIKVDQEIFVFPYLLLTQVELAQKILKSRQLMSKGAYMNARGGGFDGLAFPYEGATLGADLNSDKTGITSPHVTAAVLLAIEKYLEATRDQEFVDQNLSDIVFDGADFLHSRLRLQGETLHLLGQVSLDESLGVVDDSSSGNSFVAAALQLPFKLDPNQTRYSLWNEDASKIHISKLSGKLHASHANYSKGDKVGEADVLMMNFPLGMNVSNEMLLADLLHYEKVLSSKSSPMSKALLGINWLDAGNKNRGDLYLRALLPHFSSPFMTWNSFHPSGAVIPNHLAAIGGLLQLITYGYGGFRISEDRLQLDPTIPFNCTSIHYVGIDYLGSSVNFVVGPEQILVMLRERGPGSEALHLLEYRNKVFQKLQMNVQLSVATGRIAILPESSLDGLHARDK